MNWVKTSLVEEIQHYLKSGKQSELSSSQWSALVFVLLTSAQELEEFNLSKYFSTDKITETVVLKMMPVIAASRKAIIRCAALGVKSWSALVSALISESYNLRELHLNVKILNLSWNKLGDSGVKSLSAGLENPYCKVETLRLFNCGVSDEGCAALTSALRSNPSHLKELNLTNNNLGDSGVKSLSDVLEKPHCKLEILGFLMQPKRKNPVLPVVVQKVVFSLASGAKLTCRYPLVKTSVEFNQALHNFFTRLYGCGVTDKGCAALSSALRSNPSHLRELNLNYNNFGDSGVKSLSAVLENPKCKLEKLWLCGCGVSDEGCVALTSALRSNSSHLRDLDLSTNNLGDSGVKILSAVLENPHCKLETLRLRNCGVSNEGCAALTSALRSNPSYLRELDLSGNYLGDSGKKLLSALKDDKHYKLQTLRL
ncbi:hypothetical protein QTP70_018856 [Hemibagrus guttatus]|uniref:Uncharacterized protein n=1 Tax=Hemibagrus guttatus TaxID=175788 RepID=A0AAE0PQ70_9TELE|nr:hypothetical protein QTP70_018856 [Hemibagrus guttatus]